VHRRRKPRARAVGLLLLVTIPVACIVGIAAIEITGRLIQPVSLAMPRAEFPLIHYDPTVGWTLVPSASGIFTNDHFRGRVTVDAVGNRQNAVASTYVEGYANVLFVGDSATASLEVDDDETIPARLEQELRRRGQHVNVINLGVRGYGADQAFARAIQMADRYHPTDIVYLFTDTDVYDDNVLGPVAAELPKSAWVRGDDGAFHLQNAPVPEHRPGYRGVVLFQDRCEPVVYEHVDEAPGIGASLEARLWDFYAYRLYRNALEKVRKVFLRKVEPDPYTEVMKFGFVRDFGHEYGDEGVVRHRCRSYFDDQMRFLVDDLRARTGSPRIHVVGFPDPVAVGMLERGEEVPSVTLFESLRAGGRIDGFVNLAAQAAQERTDLRALRCPGDSHFCAEGNRWIAAQILASEVFGATP
jgi:hypothetical protein